MSALDDFRMSKFDELTELEHIIVMSDRDYHVRVAAAEELADLRNRIAELEGENERLNKRLESGCFSQDEDGNIDGVSCPIWADNQLHRSEIKLLKEEVIKLNIELDERNAWIKAQTEEQK